MKAALFSFLLLLLLATPTPAPAQQTETKPATVDAEKYPNLQAALDAVPATGGIVTLQPGTFEITAPLIVKTAETRLIGAGAATHIVNKNTDGQPALILRPANLDQDAKARLWRIHLADLRLSGNEKSGDGILAHGIQEIYLEGVSVDHHGGHGITLLDCFEDPRVADCIITYNKQCGLNIVNCHDIIVSATHFEENQDALRCVDSFNLCATGNNIDDHLRHGIIIENTYGSVLSGNMIEECNGTAIILDRDCYGITLSANVVAHHLEGGIDLRDAHGCSISANTFTIAHRYSVRVGPDSGRLAITGNNFSNTHIGGKQDKRPAEGVKPMDIDEGAGIHLVKTRDVNITGNTFGGLSTAAVWTEGACERILVANNLITDCARKLPRGSPCVNLKGAKISIEKDNLISCQK